MNYFFDVIMCLLHLKIFSINMLSLEPWLGKEAREVAHLCLTLRPHGL